MRGPNSGIFFFFSVLMGWNKIKKTQNAGGGGGRRHFFPSFGGGGGFSCAFASNKRDGGAQNWKGRGKRKWGAAGGAGPPGGPRPSILFFCETKQNKQKTGGGPGGQRPKTRGFSLGFPGAGSPGGGGGLGPVGPGKGGNSEPQPSNGGCLVRRGNPVLLCPPPVFFISAPGRGWGPPLGAGQGAGGRDGGRGGGSGGNFLGLGGGKPDRGGRKISF